MKKNETEKRYIVKVKNFDKIPSSFVMKKTVWYFKDRKVTHRRKFVNEQPVDTFTETKSSQYGKTVKKTKILNDVTTVQLDRAADYKCDVYSKFPIIDGKKLYIELVSVSPKKGRDFVFYSTESETDEHIQNKELLKKVDQVKSIKEVGEVSLYDIITKKLYR